jgi:hypothetical protein
MVNSQKRIIPKALASNIAPANTEAADKILLWRQNRRFFILAALILASYN